MEELKKTFYTKSKEIICVVSLVLVATASFFAMFFSLRYVFTNDLRFIACFYSLAACLVVAAAVRRPVISLAILLVPLACLWNYAPLFGGLFWPVALQAVLFDGAVSAKKQDTAAFYSAVVLDFASVGFYIRGAVIEKRTPLHVRGVDSPAEKYVYAVFLLLLFVLYCRMFSQGFRSASAKNRKHGGEKAPRAVGDRMHTVRLFCILNTLTAGVHCGLFFDSNYVKAAVLGQLLFLPFLVYRCAFRWEETSMFRRIWQQ